MAPTNNRQRTRASRITQTGDTVAYTDGACIGNPGPGGWAVHVVYPDGQISELDGGAFDTTNNRMELRAAIEAVNMTLDCPSVRIVTDSKYVQCGITEWISGWKRNGWTTSDGGAVLNQDLWKELDAVNHPRVTWEWIRGHAGDSGNERANDLAQEAAKRAGRRKARHNVQEAPTAHQRAR